MSELQYLFGSMNASTENDTYVAINDLHAAIGGSEKIAGDWWGYVDVFLFGLTDEFRPYANRVYVGRLRKAPTGSTDGTNSPYNARTSC